MYKEVALQVTDQALTKKRNKTSKKHFLASANRLLKLAIAGRKVLIRDQVSVISSKSDALESQKLLYQEYRARNLCDENSAKIHYSPYTFLPSTTSLISKRKGKTVGTISAIEDHTLGLPSDELYKSELDELRLSGKVLIEIGALALDSKNFKKNAHSLKSIKKFCSMAALFTSCLNHIYQFTDATHVVIMVNPKHTSIYEFIGFEQYSEIRHYPFVNKPAVPLILDIEQFYSAAHFSPAALFMQQEMKILSPQEPYRFTFADLAWRLQSTPNVVANIKEEQIEALCELHPSLKEVFKLITGSNSEIDSLSLSVQEYNQLIEAIGSTY